MRCPKNAVFIFTTGWIKRSYRISPVVRFGPIALALFLQICSLDSSYLSLFLG